MEFVPRVLSAACPEARAEVASAAKRAAGDTNLLRLAQVKKEPLRELCFSHVGAGLAPNVVPVCHVCAFVYKEHETSKLLHFWNSLLRGIFFVFASKTWFEKRQLSDGFAVDGAYLGF